MSWGKGKSTGDDELGWLASTGGDGTIFVWKLNVSLVPALNTCHIRIDHRSSLQSTPPSAESGKSTVSHQLIAQLSSAHGVSDVNTIVWCPRSGFEDVLATAGDDGFVKVWVVGPR